MMVTESEKQNWIRLVQQSHKGLADAMWRGERQAVESTHTDIILRKRDPSYDPTKHDRAVSTAYRRLASAGVLDYSERPLPSATSSIPLYLRAELLPHDPLAHSASVGGDLQSTAGSVGSGRSISASRLKPLVIDDETRLRRKIEKMQKESSPFAQTHGNAYRGYTPTGAPANRHHSPHRITQTAFQESTSQSLLSVKKQLSKSMPSLSKRSLQRMNTQDMLSYSSEMNNSECKLTHE
jgi:hypothetical protein